MYNGGSKEEGSKPLLVGQVVELEVLATCLETKGLDSKKLMGEAKARGANKARVDR